MNNANFKNNLNQPRDKMISLVLFPQLILLIISILWIYLIPKDNIIQYLKFSSVAILEGFLTGFALAIAGFSFYKFAKKNKNLQHTVELFDELLAPAFKNFKVIDMILLSMTSGFIEEVFFRGLLFPKFGIIISSIAFGLLHLPGVKYWIYAVWATLSGALFCYLFHLTNSLWLPITAHTVNNLIGMILLKKIQKK